MRAELGVGDFGARGSWHLSPLGWRNLVQGLIKVGDVAVVGVTGLLVTAWRFRNSPVPSPVISALIIGCLLAANILPLCQPRRPRPAATFTSAARLLVGWTATVMLLIVLLFAIKMTDATSRIWLGLWFVSGAVALALFRIGTTAAFSRGEATMHVAVVGSGQRLASTLTLLGSAGLSVRVAAVLDLEAGAPSEPPAAIRRLTSTAELDAVICAGLIDQVLLSMPAGGAAGERIMRSLRDLPVEVSWALDPAEMEWVLDVSGSRIVANGMVDVGRLRTLRLLERPLDGWRYVLKVVEDHLLATAMIALTLPLMLVIAGAVKADSPGPVLYRQHRRGFSRKPIAVLKFRTMHARDCDAADAPVVVQARRDDLRVTRVGRLLRRASLDELPQLINVLKGEMSLVGPRPHAVAHDDQYADVIDGYLGRHRVKPGITGWAQVNGCRGETRTLAEMCRRVEFDLAYIDNWSLGFDLWIICRTIGVGIFDRNAY